MAQSLGCWFLAYFGNFNLWLIISFLKLDAYLLEQCNLITASASGALLWAKQIIEHLGVFRPDTLEEWYAYFNTGQ
mgnify:CR=1 FL=1